MASDLTANSFSSDTLNGLFKEVYADKLQDLVPDGVMLYNEIPFIGKDKQTGNKYHQAVALGIEHGFSYGGTAGEAFELSAAVPSQVKDAEVQGYEFMLRTRLSYGAISRSMNSKAVFESATKLVVANMMKSFAKRIECMLFYGQKGLATLTLAAAATTSLVIPDAHWAPGIWSGGVKMKLVVVEDAVPANQYETSVTAVDLENKTITIASITPTNAGAHTVYHSGAVDSTGASNEFAGLHKIMTNSGSLFGISAATYDLWRSVEHDVGGSALSIEAVHKAIAKGVAKGLDGDVLCLINPDAWADLINTVEGARVFDSSYSKDTQSFGSKGIEIFSQNGKVEIRQTNMMKEGLAMILSTEELLRVGSSDITFKLPGSNDKFFRELENNAGYELRAYSDQALFCAKPASLILLKNIVNS